MADLHWTWSERRDSCLICGDPTEYGNRRFCSSRCRMKHRRSGGVLHASCILCHVQIDLTERGLTKAGEDSARTRRNDARLCASCRLSRKHRHRYSARALALRDGARCGICGTDVDMDLPWPNALSPSVDHVVARSDGGTDDPTNLQLAHLRCNMVKSFRSNWTTNAEVA